MISHSIRKRIYYRRVYTSFTFLLILIILLNNPIISGYIPLINETIQNEIEEKNLINYNIEEINNYFIENKGQWDRSLLFVTDTAYGKIGFMRDGIIHYIVKVEKNSNHEKNNDPYQMVRRDRVEQERIVDYCLVKLTFNGSTVSDVQGEEPFGTSFNYFIGNDSARWVSNARGYRSVLYKEVWPGIDIRYYCLDGTLKYDIILSPNSNPGKIAIEIEGGIPEILNDSSLIINTPIGLGLIDNGLNTYYSRSKEMIGSSFYLDGKEIHFNIDHYDANEKVVIDPHYHLNAINYSFIIGGINQEFSRDVVRDTFNNIFITGYTDSSDFPVTENAYDKLCINYDCFIIKIEKFGKIIESCTFLGGSSGEGAYDISVNDNDNILITGDTYSTDFPITNDAYSKVKKIGDAFICIFNNNLSLLIYSSFFGGSDEDIGIGIEEYNNEILIVGYTSSKDIPISEDAFQKDNIGLDNYDLFISIINIFEKTVIYSTYIGGSSYDSLNSHFLKNDILYLGGTTSSYDFNITANAYQKYIKGGDCYILIFDLTLRNITYSTFFGGSATFDFFEEITVDNNDNIYFCGQTYTNDFPILSTSFQKKLSGWADGYVVGISAKYELLFSTYIGGSSFESIMDIHVEDDNIHLIGGGAGVDFPYITEGSLNEQCGGSDGFYLVFNMNCTILEYATIIGGSGNNYCRDLMFDNYSKEAIIIGTTDSKDFPTKWDDANYTSLKGVDDVFVIKFNLTTSPTRPLNLTYIPDESKIDLFWDEPLSDGGSPVDRYRIIRGNSSDKMNITVGETRERQFTDRSLINGRKYYYYVQAHNYIDYGTTSEIIMARPGTVPSPPMNFSIDEAGNNIIRLSWEPPLKVGGFDLINYRLFKRGGMEGPFDNITIDYRQNYYQDKSVINGHLYEYYLTVTNELGESLPTPIINATPKTIPTYIQDLRSRSGPCFVLLKWSRPSYDGGSPIIDYTITRSDGTEVITKVIGPDNTEHNDTEVTNGMTYYYYIQSRNLAGYSYPSNDVIGSPKGVPDPPRSFELESSTMRVYLKWESPETDGGSPLNGYFVYKRNGLEEWERLSTTDAETTTYTDLSVVNGREYSYRVTAFNGIGESEPTQVLSATPLGLPGIPKGFSMVSGYGYVRLWWGQPDSDGGSPVIDYCLYRQGPSMTDWDVIALFASTLSYNDTTVVNGRTYRYRITSRNVVGESQSSNILEAEPGSRPSPPSNIKIVPYDGYVKVTWDYPREDGGLPIAKVTIYRGPGQGNREQVFRTDQKNGTYTDMGLTNGVRYYYSLTAMNSLGESEHSEVFEVKPFGIPTDPINLRVVDKTTTSVKIGWLPPIDDGGSPIQHYIIYRARGGGIEERVAEVVVNLTEFMDVGLKAGKSYSYSISAVNGRGESVRSDPLEVTLLKDKVAIPTLMQLIMVSILMLVVVGTVIYIKLRKREREKDEE